MKIDKKTNSQIRANKEKLVMENFASVMQKLDATFLIEDTKSEDSNIGVDVSNKNFQLSDGKYYITGGIVKDYINNNQHRVEINLNGLGEDGTKNEQTYGELVYVYNIRNDRAWITMNDGNNIDIKKQVDSKWYPTFNKMLSVLIEYSKSKINRNYE